MLNMLKPLSLAALMALASPLVAQETTTEAETADPADSLSMGTEVADTAEASGPQVGEQYLKEEFGDWALRCLKTEAGDDPCQLYQLLRDADGNEVAEISMFALPDGSRAAAGATIVAPLETLLTENIKLAVDGGETRTYPFTFCNRAGCVARVGFRNEAIASFKRGASAKITLVPAGAPDQTVELAVSLSGFTAGYDAVAALR